MSTVELKMIYLDGEPFKVCSKTEHDTTWIKVFSHNNKSGTVLFISDDEAKMCNIAQSDSADKYSILSRLNFFKSDEKFEFLLEYPDCPTRQGEYNHWTQTNNPVTSSITGYTPIHIDWTTQGWGGLEKSYGTGSSSTFINGTVQHNNWYYAIGAKSSWNDGIPASDDVAVLGRVELWVKANPDDFPLIEWEDSDTEEEIENALSKLPIRYIRDYNNGLHTTGEKTFYEIKAIDSTGDNVAIGSNVSIKGEDVILCDGNQATDDNHETFAEIKGIRNKLSSKDLTTWTHDEGVTISVENEIFDDKYVYSVQSTADGATLSLPFVLPPNLTFGELNRPFSYDHVADSSGYSKELLENGAIRFNTTAIVGITDSSLPSTLEDYNSVEWTLKFIKRDWSFYFSTNSYDSTRGWMGFYGSNLTGFEDPNGNTISLSKAVPMNEVFRLRIDFDSTGIKIYLNDVKVGERNGTYRAKSMRPTLSVHGDNTFEVHNIRYKTNVVASKPRGNIGFWARAEEETSLAINDRTFDLTTEWRYYSDTIDLSQDQLIMTPTGVKTYFCNFTGGAIIDSITNNVVENLDSPSFDKGNWQIVDYDGSKCLRSQSIKHSQTTNLVITKETDAVAFDYRIRSESGCDFFTLAIDGTQKIKVSGDGSWTHFSETLSKAPHTFTFTYYKDGSISRNEDAIFIKNIEWALPRTDVTPLEIDLGSTHLLNELNVCHYNGDDEVITTNSKIEVSTDGEFWHSVYDSAIEPLYIEKPEGKRFNLRVRPQSEPPKVYRYAPVFDEFSIANLIIYGSGAISYVKEENAIKLEASSEKDVRAVPIDLPLIKNFTLEFKMKFSGQEGGVCYRTKETKTTTSGSTSNFEYYFMLHNEPKASLGTGSVSSPGYNEIVYKNGSYEQNQWYHIKIDVNEKIHKIYIDDELVLFKEDARYLTDGNLFFRNYNSISHYKDIVLTTHERLYHEEVFTYAYDPSCELEKEIKLLGGTSKSITQEDDALILTTGSSQQTAAMFTNGGQPKDFVLECDMMLSGGEGGFIFRCHGPQIDTNDTWGYFIYFSQTETSIGHGENSNTGAWTKLVAYANPHELNRWYHVKIAVKDNDFVVYVDNKIELQCDHTKHRKAGYWGLRAYNATSGVKYKNITVSTDMSGEVIPKRVKRNYNDLPQMYLRRLDPGIIETFVPKRSPNPNGSNFSDLNCTNLQSVFNDSSPVSIIKHAYPNYHNADKYFDIDRSKFKNGTYYAVRFALGGYSKNVACAIQFEFEEDEGFKSLDECVNLGLMDPVVLTKTDNNTSYPIQDKEHIYRGTLSSATSGWPSYLILFKPTGRLKRIYYRVNVSSFTSGTVTDYVDVCSTNIRQISETPLTPLQQRFLIDDGGVFKTATCPIDDIKANELNIRYIRDWLNGSTANTGSHWVEIQALTSGGTNVAQGKSVFPADERQVIWDYDNGTDAYGCINLTDGSTHTNYYSETCYISNSINSDLRTWTNNNPTNYLVAKEPEFFKGDAVYSITIKDGFSVPRNNGVHTSGESTATNTYYYLSFWAKAEATTDIEIGLQGYGGDRNPHFTLTTQWKRYSMRVKMAETTAFFAIKLMTNTKVYFSKCAMSKNTLSVQGPHGLVVDLGEPTSIEQIKVYHYYNDGRTYYGTKTEVSEDGQTWYTIYDSAVNGAYSESSNGKTHNLAAIDVQRIHYDEFEFTELGNQLTTNLFLTDSMNEDMIQIAASFRHLLESPTPKIMMYMTDDEYKNGFELKLSERGNPYGQLVRYAKDVDFDQWYITKITKCEITASVGQGNFIYVALSIDEGETWLTYDDNQEDWKSVSLDDAEEEIISSWMPVEKLTNVTAAKWIEVSETKKMKLVWYARQTNSLVPCSLRNIKFSFDRRMYYKDLKIRYVREWLNGSTSNGGNHWVEIQVFNTSGTNISNNKTVTTSHSSTTNISYVVDNSYGNSNYWYGFDPDPETGGWVMIDLGGEHSVNQIKTWHYYSDNRKYHDIKLEISEDGDTWYTLFDSNIHGEYTETSSGYTHTFGNKYLQPIFE